MTQHDSEQNNTADGPGRVVRWVQYDAPLFVRVAGTHRCGQQDETVQVSAGAS